MVLHKDKAYNISWCKDVKICYYCGKPDHIACFCYKVKKINKENANNTKEDDDYTFATQHGVDLKAMCKWIIYLRASNNITSHRTA